MRDRGDQYDSRVDTYQHIQEVRNRLCAVAVDLMQRGLVHDESKLHEPELSVFDEYTPKLRDSTYGSDEYKAFLVGMGAGLRHHYAVNDHHPEHHIAGIHDMDLVQLIEMLADWKAATLRHEGGDLGRSIELNASRFGYGEPMIQLLKRTARNRGWM